MEKETLGILISSTVYHELAVELAEAAVRAGKQVRIHILGRAMDMAPSGILSRLAGRARIQVCDGGADGDGFTCRELPDGMERISADALVAGMSACGRHVVF